MHCFDITRELLSTAPYPGDPTPKLTFRADARCGDGYTLSELHCSVHAATHIDAPRHFVRDGKAIDAMPISTFFGDCTVLTVGEPDILPQALPEKGLQKRVLLRGNGILSIDAAKKLLELGVVLVGTERASIAGEGDEATLHRLMLDRGVAILENVDLASVPDGAYFLSALPLRIAGAEAAPCRAVLFCVAENAEFEQEKAQEKTF